MNGSSAEVFNQFCQLRLVEPSITFGESNGSVCCSISVPGVPIQEEGLGSNMQDARAKAITRYVQILQNNGLMCPQPGTIQPSKKSKKRKGSTAPAPASKRLLGADGPGTTGAIPAGPVQVQKRGCDEAVTSKMVELLRANRFPEAMQKLKQLARTDQRLSVKQMAKFADSMGMRTTEVAARDFFDAIDALDLADVPAAGEKYFGRFVRWALREFLTEALTTVNLAKTLPGYVMERNGTCWQQAMTSAGSRASLLKVRPAPNPNGSIQKGDWILLTFPHTSPPSEVALSHSYKSSKSQSQPQNVAGTDMGICAEAEIQAIHSFPEFHIEVKIMGGQVDGVAAKLKDKICRMDKIANHVTLSRQLDALQKVCSVELAPDWNGNLIAASLLSQEAIWVKHLLLCADSWHTGKEPDLAAGAGSPVSDTSFPHNSLLLEANDSQRRALQSAYGRQLTLIQGPPGTGKTTTAVLLVRAWISSNLRPVLCAADSNIAVDNLVDGCVQDQLNVIRIGRPEATRPDLEQYNLLDMVKDIDPMYQFSMQKQILSNADVVCATCSGADHPLIRHMNFARVLVDEAAQATELSTLVPLMKMKPDGCVTLVGDHRQLPPSISNMDVYAEGFGTSLFERMAGQGVQPYLLNIQYRMHPCISAFPSSTYYNGEILSGVPGTSRRPPQGIAWPVSEVPITFLPVGGQEIAEGTSWSNNQEVEAVQELLTSLFAWDDITQEGVGIITPYAAQARLLRRTLGCPPPGKRAMAGGPNGNVEVSSVDGFQGREKDVIIVSTVRANSRGHVGFVGDRRRLNVTLTRAKRGLVVVGCFETLSQDEHGWGAWLHWAKERGLVAGCSATVPEAAEALTSLGTLTSHQLLQLGFTAG